MSAQLRLRFSQEELDYLRKVLDLEQMPGLARRGEQARNLPEEQRQLLLLTADRSLRARGLVGLLDNDRRSINPLVAGLLRAYAQPQPALFLSTIRTGWGRGQWLYVFNEQIIFEQCEPEPGVLQFLVLNKQADFQERLSHLLQFPQPANGTAPGKLRLAGDASRPYRVQVAESEPESENGLEPGRLSCESLARGVDLVRRNPEQARQIFARELPAPTAEALVEAYSTVQVTHYLSRWSPRTGHVEATLTILQDIKQAFLLSLESADAQDVDVAPATFAQAWARVVDFAPRLAPHTKKVASEDGGGTH